jgi:transposase
MVLHAIDDWSVPKETARVARAAFRRGNIYLLLRDRLGCWYKDSAFAGLFTSHQGRPAEAPGRLALVTVFQFAEGLSDRQAAEAVCSRIDWKYCLGLRLEDSGFDFTILHAFRERLLGGGAVQQLLDDLLVRCREEGLIKAKGRQRTDSTHVLAAVRQLNRLELVGETLRAALNALAVAAPQWLMQQAEQEWFDRYGLRFEQERLPSGAEKQRKLGETIGRDGQKLLSAVASEGAPAWLKEVPAIQRLQQVWVQQYKMEKGELRWRGREELPPNQELIMSPYDPEMRNRTKRKLNWNGYLVHVTETCDDEGPHLISHVETTVSTTGDSKMTPSIHEALEAKGLLPSEHLTDTNYITADHILDSKDDYGIDLCGPVPPDTSWQTKAGEGYGLSSFQIDWSGQRVTCPQGQVSRSWRLREGDPPYPTIEVSFALQGCLACPTRSHCTRSTKRPRLILLRPQREHEVLQARRVYQKTEEFKTRYRKRAGIEGTISQGTRSLGLRHTRYIGLAKTHLQHVVTAAAMNLLRLASWFDGRHRAMTRVSHFAALAPLS